MLKLAWNNLRKVEDILFLNSGGGEVTLGAILKANVSVGSPRKKI